MENGWNLFNVTSSSSSSSFGRVHNSRNCTTTAAWDVSESGTASTTTSRIDWSANGIINSHDSFPSSASTNTTIPSSSVTATQEKSAVALQLRALMVADEGNRHHLHHYSNSSSDASRLYYTAGTGTGGSHNYFPDPHLMCLKLGKRHYFGDANVAATPQLGDHQPGAVPNYSITKKGKPYYDVGADSGFVGDEPSMTSVGVGVTLASSIAVPRCQVDGCNVVLLNAKDYHRRHKVCESHSKAPKVFVLGLEQRFCQQCSRFHAVSEFDESKRSCRRRLAGHNERRRKSSQQQEHSGIRNQTQGRHEYLPLNTGCALSLLSSKNDSWISATDLPARCSAALRELIAENRAAILARQLILDKDWWHWQYYYHSAADQDMIINGRQQSGGSLILNNYQQQIPATTGSNNWERMSGEEAEANAQVTLDLMQAPNSEFGFLSTMRGKSKEDDDDDDDDDEEECPELWSTSFGGAHVL